MKLSGLYIVLILLLSNTFSVYGAKDLKNGFIITNENDTIHGYINLRSNAINTKSCEFQRDLTGETESFAPGEIYAYRVVGEKFYITKTITINEEERTVFLEKLMDAIVDLYFYKDALSEYFYIEKEGTIYELSNNLQEVKINAAGPHNQSKKIIKESNQYIGTLKYVFQDAPELYNEINNTRFAFKSLIEITESYHKQVCDDFECIDYTKSTDQIIFLDPYFGISNSRMSFRSSEQFTASNPLVLGLDVRFKPTKMHYLWNLLIGVNFSHNSFNTNRYYNAYEDNNYQISLNYSVLRIPLILEYSFPSRSFQPFIFAGVTNAFTFNAENNINIFYLNAVSGEIRDGYEVESDVRTHHIGFSSGIGMRYKLKNQSDLQFKLNFEHRFPLYQHYDLLDYHNVNTIGFTVGYSFPLN